LALVLDTSDVSLGSPVNNISEDFVGIGLVDIDGLRGGVDEAEHGGTVFSIGHVSKRGDTNSVGVALSVVLVDPVKVVAEDLETVLELIARVSSIEVDHKVQEGSLVFLLREGKTSRNEG
jgi:hypothetical protein